MISYYWPTIVPILIGTVFIIIGTVFIIIGLKFVYDKWGVRLAIIFFLYIYSLYNFSFHLALAEKPQDVLLIYSFIFLSITTLIALFKSNNEKTNLILFFCKLLDISSWRIYLLPIYLMLISFIIVRFFRYGLLSQLYLVETNINSSIFIFFAMIVPTSILYRIIYNALYRLYSGKDHLITVACLYELCNLRNYILPNISTNVFLIVMLGSHLLLPVIHTLIIYFPENPTAKGGILSPPQVIENMPSSPNDGIITIWLDNFFSITYEDLIASGAQDIGRETPMSTLPRHTLLLNRQIWVKTDENIYHKSSYLKERFKSSISSFEYPIWNIPPFETIIQFPNLFSTVNQNLNSPLHNLAEWVRESTSLLTPQGRVYPLNVMYTDLHTLTPLYTAGLVHITHNDNTRNILMLNEVEAGTVRGRSRGIDWWDLLEKTSEILGGLRDPNIKTIIIFKDSKFACFCYEPNLHAHYGLNNKYFKFQGLVAIAFTEEGIKLKAQCNKFFPQFVLQEYGVRNPWVTSTMLNYISGEYFGRYHNITDEFYPPVFSNTEKFVGTCHEAGLRKNVFLSPSCWLRTYNST